MSGGPKIPRVSIGVPVYNGAKFLTATLNSILAQTFTDFEVILCDNGSTDSTPQICDDYAARDSRVRVWRSPKNLGPAANYNKCFALSRGELFKWQAGDDVIAPTFLEKCIAKLDSDPSLVSVYSLSKRINERGEIFGEYECELDLAHESAATRFARYIFVDHRKHHAAELWGVTRASAMEYWHPVKGAFPSADRIVISRWLSCGKLARVEEYLFFDRQHTGRSEVCVDRAKVRGGSRIAQKIGCGPLPPYQWWDACKKDKIVFPEWKWITEYYRSAIFGPMDVFEKIACTAVVSGLVVKFTPRLLRDVLIAAELLIYRVMAQVLSPVTPAPSH